MKKSITSLKSTHLDDCNGLPFSYHLIVASGSAVNAHSIVLFLPMITSLFLGGMPSVHLGGTKEKHITLLRFSLFIMLYKVVLTFKSVNETLLCNHSSESYLAVFSCSTVYYMLHKVVLGGKAIVYDYS